ncbi:MAG: hypothetical protein M3Y69_01295 [Verrucomicrobiota bacterium]|nr:hypothetical protein [Verrucomicrobiota bacterium]
MSAAELIEQIKALPPAELEIVRDFVLDTAANKLPPAKYATDEQFDAAAARVFEKHTELLRKLAQ